MAEPTDSLEVVFTVDTEIWCNGWQNIDAEFADAFRAYIHGPTARGDYGLPFQLRVLRDHGLRGVFFVEPLFAMRFGIGPLEEIVGLILEAGQTVELHLHTEWVDEARVPMFPDQVGKKQHIRCYSSEQQLCLLQKGIELLNEAGASSLRAFRAGSFGANNDTVRALAHTDIRIDSSFNPTAPPCAMEVTGPLHQPAMIGDVLEVPVSVFIDGFGRLRPAQLTACSFEEIRSALTQARDQGWHQFVILSHSFELLNQPMTRPNPVVVRRFLKLCEFLAKNCGQFATADFSIPFHASSGRAEALRCPTVATIGRLAEQAWSRLQ